MGGGKGEEAYSVPSGINDAFYAPANGLESIGANTGGALRNAFDSLARFGREVLCCFTTGEQRKSQRLFSYLSL